MSMIGINTYWVLLSVLSLSAACAFIGSHIMLLKESLKADAMSHATLPGVAIGFFLSLFLGLEDGRYLPLLLLGAAFTGGLSAYLINVIVQNKRLSEDTAIASTLSVFFGLGIVFLSIIQNMTSGSRSGLDSFLLGQISSMNSDDAVIIGCISLLIIFIGTMYHKRLILFSFDSIYAGLRDEKIKNTKSILTGLALIVVCLGLKTAGAVLILAMLIIPPASARLLSDQIIAMIFIAVFIGALAATTGALISAFHPNIPAGATIVIFNAAIFLACLIVSKAKSTIGKPVS